MNGLWKNGTYTEPMPVTNWSTGSTLGLQLNVTSDVRTRILDHLAYLDSRPVDDVGPWQRLDALFLLLFAPEMHIA